MQGSTNTQDLGPWVLALKHAVSANIRTIGSTGHKGTRGSACKETHFGALKGLSLFTEYHGNIIDNAGLCDISISKVNISAAITN